jgi:hypothetical protein
MGIYCAVISGNHGEKEQVAIVHHAWCTQVLETVCEEMIMGNRAVVAGLDSDEKLSVSIEVKIISGRKIPVVWHKCTEAPPANKRARINDGGALILDRTPVGKMVGCLSCGAMTTTYNMVCCGCGKPLWSGFAEKMYEYNRRIREGIKENNKKLVAISKQSIKIAVEERGKIVGWKIDDNGFAKSPPAMKQEAPQYKMSNEEKVESSPVPVIPKPPKHRKLPPKRIK